MTSYFQKMVENTMAVTLQNWRVGGMCMMRKTTYPFLALSLTTVLPDSSLFTLPSFRSNQTKQNREKEKFLNAPSLSNEKACFFFFLMTSESLLRGWKPWESGNITKIITLIKLHFYLISFKTKCHFTKWKELPQNIGMILWDFHAISNWFGYFLTH